MRLLSFYLPQFHAIPENDAWWGKGFTEWTNTKKASPLFKGHYQPRIPLGNNYYDLLNVKTLEWQTDLAKKFGIWGFCIYHYWFKGGKKLLEKPVELLLANRDIDMNFCLCWANENWTRCWDGKDREVLIEQEYGNEQEWKEHFDYLLPFFKDSRYIKFGGKPVFVLYKPELIPNLREMIDFWNTQAVLHGMPGLCIISQNPSAFSLSEKDNSAIDYNILFEPIYTIKNESKINAKNFFSMLIRRPFYACGSIIMQGVKKMSSALNKRRKRRKGIEVYRFDSIWKMITSRKYVNKKIIPGAFSDWDNTSRRGMNGMVIRGSSPAKYRKYLSKLIKRASDECSTDFIFITAWNEWAEGSYLEPDEKHEFSYLQATSDALKDNSLN